MSFTIDDDKYLSYNNKKIVFSKLKKTEKKILKIVPTLKQDFDMFYVYINDFNDKNILYIYIYNNYKLTKETYKEGLVYKQDVKDNIIYYNEIINKEINSIDKILIYILKYPEIINTINNYIEINPNIINIIIPSKQLIEMHLNKMYFENIKLITEYIKNMSPIFNLIINLNNETNIPFKYIIFIIFTIVNNKEDNIYINDNLYYNFLNLIYTPLELYIKDFEIKQQQQQE